MEEVIIALIRGFIANLYLCSVATRESTTATDHVQYEFRCIFFISEYSRESTWIFFGTTISIRLQHFIYRKWNFTWAHDNLVTDTLFIYLHVNGVAAYVKSYFWVRWYRHTSRWAYAQKNVAEDSSVPKNRKYKLCLIWCRFPQKNHNASIYLFGSLFRSRAPCETAGKMIKWTPLSARLDNALTLELFSCVMANVAVLVACVAGRAPSSGCMCAYLFVVCHPQPNTTKIHSVDQPKTNKSREKNRNLFLVSLRAYAPRCWNGARV